MHMPASWPCGLNITLTPTPSESEKPAALTLFPHGNKRASAGGQLTGSKRRYGHNQRGICLRGRGWGKTPKTPERPSVLLGVLSINHLKTIT